MMKLVNNTMPVILDSSSDGVWLDLNTSADVLHSLCASFASERKEAIAVRRCGTLHVFSAGQGWAERCRGVHQNHQTKTRLQFRS